MAVWLLQLGLIFNTSFYFEVIISITLGKGRPGRDIRVH